MAQQNILNKVKTADGYDTLYPLTPYQIHYATAVTGDGTNYAVTIDLPADNIKLPITVCFTPNMTNQSGCTISVNGLTSKQIYTNNNTLLTSNVLKTTNSCMVLYDTNKATLLNSQALSQFANDSGFAPVQASTVDLNPGVSVLATGTIYLVYE